MTDTQEYSQATDVLGYTVHVATPEEWNSYTTADFMRYNAIIIPDPTCGTVSEIDFFDATKAAWGPAIMGNIILIGTDPSFHASSRPGALTLIDDGVEFAAAGNGTGLYFALSCYYDSVASSTVDALSYFGTITVRGQLACYNDAHLVANSSALGRLDDAALSDWSCSVHEVFTGYPTTGLFGFEPLAIAEGATGDGQRDFADGSNGIPYIIVKGATPAGCGDGIYDPTVEEECDDGPLNGTPESSCSSSCKCLNGSIAPGVCRTNSTTSSSSMSTASSTTTSAPLSTNSSVLSSTPESSMGHDCGVNYNICFGCHEFCGGFDFVNHYSIYRLKFELFQRCLYLGIHHNSRDLKLRDWVIIVSCVVFSGPTRVSQFKSPNTSVPVSSTAESSSESSTSAGYLSSSKRPSKSEESSMISTTKTSTFVTTIATNISTSQVTDMTTTKVTTMYDLPAADNFTVFVGSELELKWCAFFWGTILWGTFVRRTTFRDTFHGGTILGVIVRRVLIPNDRVFDEYTPISAIVIRTKLCALCRKLAHHQNCEPELANNAHHKSHHYHCHESFDNADYGFYNDFRGNLDH
ncbi:hypothetical protein SLS53_002649 [Cytospora paraplurivora]|uniref:Uncharacterized protein n=1 Tax=Cytospora paraplurivora TaxID=2898453 RepID=A0AAN9UGB3_9PEZI